MWKSTFGKIVIRTVLFIAIFIGTALIVNSISNRGSRAAYVELRGTTLPVVFTCQDGEILSPMPAYKQEMNTSLIRDAIIPLYGDDRTVTVYLDERNMMLSGVKYQLRDTESGNLIEEGDPEILPEQKDGMTGYTCNLRMDMTRNKEYTFSVVVNDNLGDVLRFYARVIRLSRDRLSTMLASAEDFHKLLRSEKNDKLKATLKEYLDDDPPDDFMRDDPGFVSFQSDYDTLTWGELKPELIGTAERSLTEITDDSGTLVYRYRICSADEEMTQLTYYDVEEHFSLEFVPELDASRVVNYFRRVRENYRDENFDRNLNGVRFGVSDHEPDYLLSDDLKFMIFVADDSVWYYDYDLSTITRVYGAEKTSFIYAEAQGFKLLSVNEKEAYYAIYGRMNSGNHEGENGILVQRFSTGDRTIEDCVFIRTDLPYFWLEQELEKLLYMDPVNGQLYYLLDRSLRSFSVEKKEESILVEGLDESEVYVSSDSSVVAFPDSGDSSSGYDSLQLWDLSSGKKTSITKTGMKLAPLDFVGTDFVYGAARPDCVGKAADGSTTYLFSSIIFISRSGKEEKNYQKSGILVSDVTFLSNTIYLSRVTSVEGGRITASAAPDYISYKVEETRGRAVLSNAGADGGYGLVFPSFMYLTSIPEHLIARLSEAAGTEVYVDGTTDSDCAYLWQAGELMDRSRRIGSLVRDAVTIRGSVKLLDGSVLYRIRTGAPYLTVADQVEYVPAEEGEDGYVSCLIMSLQMAGVSSDRETVNSILREGTAGSWERAFNEISGGTVRGLNLSGANLETALLYLGDGIPFAVRLEDRYVLVVSFNQDAIRYYDPIRNYEIRTARSDFRRKVADSGNEFYLYVSD